MAVAAFFAGTHTAAGTLMQEHAESAGELHSLLDRALVRAKDSCITQGTG